MHSPSSFLIVPGLFIFMLLAMGIGFRSGRRKQASAAEPIAQANSVLVSMPGLLALLLAVTFSAALQRYDDRSRTVVAEANAIGTQLGAEHHAYHESSEANVASWLDDLMSKAYSSAGLIIVLDSVAA